MHGDELPQPPEDLVRVLGLPAWNDTHGTGDETRWRLGYAWARAGRFDLAWSWWSTISDPTFAPRVRGGRAAVLRQLSLYAQAEHEDEAGLALAARPEDRAALLIGYAADAIARADQAGAAARFAEAARALSLVEPGPVADRQSIRFGWVAAELQLLTGHGDAAPLLPKIGADGEVVAPQRYEAGSRYHLAKGLLFAGVLAADLPTLDRAAELAPGSLAWAVHLARADLGAPDGDERARRNWQAVVPPPPYAGLVADSPNGKRLA